MDARVAAPKWMTGAEAHAWDRSITRIAANGIDPLPLLAIARQYAAANKHRDIAVRVYNGSVEFGDTTSPLFDRESNGSQVWVVCRGGTLVTIMFRRNNQPATPEALRVGQVFLKPKAK